MVHKTAIVLCRTLEGKDLASRRQNRAVPRCAATVGLTPHAVVSRLKHQGMRAAGRDLLHLLNLALPEGRETEARFLGGSCLRSFLGYELQRVVLC